MLIKMENSNYIDQNLWELLFEFVGKIKLTGWFRSINETWPVVINNEHLNDDITVKTKKNSYEHKNVHKYVIHLMDLYIHISVL